MLETVQRTTQPGSAIPADDPSRKLSVIDPDDPTLRHVAVVGDTYTILLSGAETGGKYSLIDMSVPHCGGPGPHRHDFEEMFHILDGEIQFTFRGEKRSQLAEFFARLHKRAGLMKTRTCALVTFGAHSCRLAQWQNVSTRSRCCRAAPRTSWARAMRWRSPLSIAASTASAASRAASSCCPRRSAIQAIVRSESARRADEAAACEISSASTSRRSARAVSPRRNRR